MKKFSEHQIVSILKEAEVGISIKELCRKYGMAVSTFYKWCRKMDKEKKPCRKRPKNYLGSQQVLQSNACDENLDTRSYLNSRAIRTLSEFCAGIFL